MKLGPKLFSLGWFQNVTGRQKAWDWNMLFAEEVGAELCDLDAAKIERFVETGDASELVGEKWLDDAARKRLAAARPRVLAAREGKDDAAPEREMLLAWVEAIDRRVIPHTFKHDQGSPVGEVAIKDEMATRTQKLGLNRYQAGFMLQVWSGCLSAAKIIAIGTRSGRNWPWLRRKYAKRLELDLERHTLGYQMGVTLGHKFKLGRHEPVSYFGIPRGNILRSAACV